MTMEMAIILLVAVGAAFAGWELGFSHGKRLRLSERLKIEDAKYREGLNRGREEFVVRFWQLQKVMRVFKRVGIVLALESPDKAREFLAQTEGEKTDMGDDACRKELAL